MLTSRSSMNCRESRAAIVLTLSDGRKIGGVWEGNGFVSTYRADGDILIAVPYVLDQETGWIKE